MKSGKAFRIVCAAFAGLLVALAVLFVLLPGREKPKLSLSEKRTVITPTPGTELQDSVEANTPAPTPVHIIQTPAPVLPSGAVNLLSDGDALFALDSRETAELLLRTYFQQCAYENIDDHSILLKATLVSSVSTAPADGTVEYLSFDAALNKLNKNRSLISVQRSVERASVSVSEPGVRSQKSDLLPVGARFYLQLGTGARTLTLSELLYKDGFAASDVETLNRQVSQLTQTSFLEGTYRVAQPDREPGSKEGRRGKDKGNLRFSAPVKGDVVSYFGIRFGEMHYGIDYSASTGSRIYAPEDGTVIFCGERPGYGTVVEIKHENGFVSRLSSCANVAVELEQHVKRGAVIGYMPAIEGRGAPILHYELLIDGIPYNPLYYLS